MTSRIHHRHLWSLETVSGAELLSLIETARALKRADGAQRLLGGRHIALLGSGSDNGYVAAFERAAEQLGAKVAVIRLGGADGYGRLLGRLYDAVDCQGMDEHAVAQIDRDAGVPVYNGLADRNHPTQVLTVLLGLRERCAKPLPQLRVAFVGDTGTAAGQHFLEAAMLVGIELRVASPRECRPGPEWLSRLETLAGTSGARIVWSESAAEAAEGADAVLETNDVEPAVTPSAEHAYALQAMLISSLA